MRTPEAPFGDRKYYPRIVFGIRLDNNIVDLREAEKTLAKALETLNKESPWVNRVESGEAHRELTFKVLPFQSYLRFASDSGIRPLKRDQMFAFEKFVERLSRKLSKCEFSDFYVSSVSVDLNFLTTYRIAAQK